MEEVKIKLQGKEYTGSVTDDDAIFFASMYYNADEKKLAEEGLEQEAFLHLADRFKNSLAKAEDKEKEEAEMISNIALKIRRAIANDWETRKIVCWRILECFPDIDSKLIYWHSESKFGIRLSMEELIGLFMQVIATAFKVYQTEETALVKVEKPTVDPVAELNEQELIDKQIAELTQRKAQLNTAIEA